MSSGATTCSTPGTSRASTRSCWLTNHISVITISEAPSAGRYGSPRFTNRKTKPSSSDLNARNLASLYPKLLAHKPYLRYHDFGGTIGGPVWIPKIYEQKDKTFFFRSERQEPREPLPEAAGSQTISPLSRFRRHHRRAGMDPQDLRTERQNLLLLLRRGAQQPDLRQCNHGPAYGQYVAGSVHAPGLRSV